MSVILNTSATNLSTASGFLKADSYNVGCFNATHVQVTAGGVAIAFTPTVGHNCAGAIIGLCTGTAGANNATVSNYSVTVKLQQNTGSWVDVAGATATLTASQITNGVANQQADAWFRAFTFGTPAAVTAAANTWRFLVLLGTGTAGTWYLPTSNGSAPFFAEITNIAATATSGSDCLICAAPVTVDTTFTTKAYLGTGDAAFGVGLIVCSSASALTSTSGNENFTWSNPPAASYTFTVDGVCVLTGVGHGGIRIGSSASRISVANQAVFTFVSSPTAGTQKGFKNPGPYYGMKHSLMAYGAYPANMNARTNAYLNTGATSLTTTSDLSSWRSGATFMISRSDIGTAANYGDATLYTVNGTPTFSGGVTTLNFTPALAVANRQVGATIMPVSDYGVEINDPSSTVSPFIAPSNFVLDGVYCSGTQLDVGSYRAGLDSLDDSANMSQWQVKNMFIMQTNASRAFLINPFTPSKGVTIDTVMCRYIVPIFNSIISNYPSASFTYQNCVVYGCFGGGSAAVAIPIGSGFFTSDNNSFENSQSCSYYIDGTNVTCTNCRVYVAYTGFAKGAVTLGKYTALINPTNLSNLSLDSCQGIAFGSNPVALGVLSAFQFGQTQANSQDIDFNISTLLNTTMDSPVGISTVITADSSNLLNTSKLRTQNFGGTSGDYRAWLPQGYLYSNTGKIDAYLTSTTATMSNVYNLSSSTIAGNTIAAAVNCLIGNAAYYAGSYTLPSISITYDNGSTASASATASTTQQQLIATFTPATNNNSLVVNLNQQTNASTANSKVTWDTLTVASLKYGYTYQTFTETLTHTLDDIIYNVPTLVANTYITQSTQATVHAYTGFAYNSGTNTLTISSNHTVKELYDWVQDLLQTNPAYFINSGQLFNTIDGVNYTSAMNITINTGVALTGGGSINVGSYTWTNSGTYDGYVITSTNRLVHVLINTIVSGSTVQIYDTTSSTELFNGVVAATSKDYIFTYTADHSVRIRVRYAVGTTGYLPYEYTGTVTNTGLSLNVSQVSDSVFNANAIDGSTVTEFSLSGSTIKIYVSATTNTTSGQRMYNWYEYAISTTTYIGLQPSDITAQTAWSYVLADALLIYNQKTAVLYISGANINNVSGNGQVIDTTGGPININGYFPFSSAADVGTAVWSNSKALSVPKFIGLK